MSSTTEQPDGHHTRFARVPTFAEYCGPISNRDGNRRSTSFWKSYAVLNDWYRM